MTDLKQMFRKMLEAGVPIECIHVYCGKRAHEKLNAALESMARYPVLKHPAVSAPMPPMDPALIVNGIRIFVNEMLPEDAVVGVDSRRLGAPIGAMPAEQH